MAVLSTQGTLNRQGEVAKGKTMKTLKDAGPWAEIVYTCDHCGWSGQAGDNWERTNGSGGRPGERGLARFAIRE